MSSATATRLRYRYGAHGRAHTSPAIVSSTVAWTAPDPAAQIARLMSAAGRPPKMPPERSIIHRRGSFKDSPQTSSLVDKYISDSKERTTRKDESIEALMERYRPGSNGRVSDACEVRRPSITSARLSGSDVKIKFDVSVTDTSEVPRRPSIVSAVGHMPVGGSSSRSGRLARISQSNIRPFGSGAGSHHSAHAPGGQPLSGPDRSSPCRKEVRHRFEIVKKLGSGTYGKVSLAFDHKFEREVAVKLIKKSAIENKADLVRIRREIRIMSALNHPNIIQIFEVFENKEKIILVMEYASGGELYDYVSKFGSLPEAEARRIFRQITSAVLYCHKHEVAHRDLKLENILLDQDNNAKIADFGLSNYFSDKTLLTTFCGSPLYASPEIINGTPYKGPEVDCWSLGILLYTLVYGSMPFDGRDFNRMVRQIKRGAYYEPDTPSTASMLIRNMLRVNPDRRADIFDIASHWWLNLEENMPVIQELPENQVTDTTPLTERAETMIVQDLADETDVFMEFGHLSSETRRKIEEFRRRRKEAEEYIDNSPVKPPKARKVEGEKEEMRTDEKSLRGETGISTKASDDPLERLKQIENRLAQKQRLPTVPQTAPPDKIVPGSTKPTSVEDKQINGKAKSPEQPEDPKTARPQTTQIGSRAPSFVPVHEPSPPPSRRGSTALRGSAFRIETDSLNMLMNQVLEQMEKGPVSLNLVARIKAHPLYDTRPMVKELLESIIAAQPDSVQKQTSKLLEQKSQGTLKKKKPEATKPEKKLNMNERPWHSVEVGFDPDADDDVMRTSTVSTATDVTVQDTSFEDSDDQKELTPQAEPSTGIENRQTQTETAPEESEEEEGEEYSDSEMEELADVVEHVEEVKCPEAPTIATEHIEAPPPPDPAISPTPQYLDAFDRGLIKRQSKGKYQHNRVDMYGRGVSTECESPTLSRKVVGGPQPTHEHAPFLFDKAKKIIMQYPGKPDPAELEDVLKRKKKNWLKSIQDERKPAPPPTNCVGSVPPRTPPPVHSDVESEEEEDEEEDEEEEEEEEESDVEIQRPRRAIVGTVRRDGDKIATTITEIGGIRKASYMQSAPASIHASMSPEPVKSTLPPVPTSTANAKYFVTVAELKAKPVESREPRPYTGISTAGGNVANTKTTIEKKIAEKTIPAPATTESPYSPEKPADRPTAYTNLLFRPMADSHLMHFYTPNEPEKKERQESESTAAFIRRKNRERRFRNRTIGAPEEILMRQTPSAFEEKLTEDYHPHYPSTADPFYSHHTGVGSSLLGYVRPRYHEDSYRRRETDERPLSPVGRVHTSTTRDVRGHSFLHDGSPERSDYSSSRNAAYAVSDTKTYYGSNASPSYSRKFDDANLQSWASEPRRFEVYKTRAERDREMNTMHTTPTAPHSYRPSSYLATTSDRPLSTYSYQSRQEPHRTETSGYRRTLDYERSVTPGSENPAALSLAGGDATSTARATARRVHSALTDSDRRAYNRSRSMDRKRVDQDYTSNLRSRLMTPETPDYAYVNYHDTSNGRASSQIKDEKGAPRSILKNKQSAETEPRPDSGRSSIGESSGPVRSVIDRLRRHLSLEKTPGPPSTTTTATTRAPSLGMKDSELTTGGDDSPKKKRSLLSSFNRRRTSEVRIGADGKLITNGLDDVHYKRPNSPIDKIKSFFRKTDSSPQTQHSSDFYTSNRYTSSLDKTSFPSSNVATSRDTYVPQYRKYPGSSSRDPMTAVNRYSYTPGLTDQRRHWYDDHNLY